ncbi:TetR/AcrR family transcriptional regulator [uncultured Pontibacter sp.]|uniref:TetR/AcrR family transcriptional regulator n=1 Tax=uncultured Pontibacter sp. TaxID=453356 RepID=UPI0026146085|nr:TetR/AcrR family transcriptional regulator [uncultured Pontibacter sp.]
MARPSDPNKLQQIKQATVETIVRLGLENTTISIIAREAGVSEGYLYRHYASKQELIHSLFQERMESILAQINSILEQDNMSLAQVMESYITGVVTRAIEAPDASKFYYTLLHNYNFEVSAEQKASTLKTLQRLQALGLKNNQVNPDISLEQLYLSSFVLTIDYVHLKMRKLVSPEGLTLTDIPVITRHVLRTLGYNNLK